MSLTRRRLTLTAAAIALGLTPALAADPVKIGFIAPLTGPFAQSGKLMELGARLYMQQNGAEAGGRNVELIVKDDGGAPDATKRIAQELIANDKVSVLAGFVLTPSAMAAAPVATQAKTPLVVMNAAASAVTEASPFITRTGFNVPQTVVPIADWTADQGIKKVVTLVTDYAPGIDTETTFVQRFTARGGQVVDSLRTPLRSPDFAPFLQRVADAKPDALFVFVPSGMGAQLMKQFIERGLDKTGIKFIAEGSVTEDDILPQMGDAAIGMVTSHHYSVAHDSPENKAFVAAFKAANNNMRPNLFSVQGYDGMKLIYEALKKTGGSTDGEALIGAMKGMAWVSPRGPISIDPETRDIIQNVYIRKVEKVGGELYNIEFATVPNVKDPVKAAKKQ